MKKNRMFQATLVGCATVASVGFFACSSSTTTMTPEDASVESSADTSTDTSITDGPAKDSATKDRNISDASSSDSTLMDSSVAMEAEAAAPASCVPLNLCDTFDQLFGIVPDGGELAACSTATPANICPDRIDSWVMAILNAYGTPPGATTDCNISALLNASNDSGTSGLLSPAEAQNYGNNQLEAYILSFIGCPSPGAGSGPDGGAIPPFGLIPAPLAGGVFTTADLSLLSTYWSLAIQNAVINGATVFGTTLTAEQISAIQAELDCEAALEPGVVQSEKYNYSTCPVDGGHD
jgi:hypothetical protein